MKPDRVVTVLIGIASFLVGVGASDWLLDALEVRYVSSARVTFLLFGLTFAAGALVVRALSRPPKP